MDMPTQGEPSDKKVARTISAYLAAHKNKPVKPSDMIPCTMVYEFIDEIKSKIG